MEKPSLMFYSNAFWTHSGYGITCGNVLPRLKEAGYTVAMAPNVGLHGGIIDIGDIPVLPAGSGFSEVETINHMIHYEYDFLVVLYDLWGLTHLPRLVTENRILLIPWVPVDSDRIYPDMLPGLNASFHTVPMSEYGKKLLQDVGYKNITRIHLGADTKEFRLLDERPKEVHRRNLKFEEDAFVIGLVQMNKDFRKLIPDQVEAVKIFMEENPDIKTRLYLHTETYLRGGFQLERILSYPWVNMDSITLFPDQYWHLLGWNNRQMCKMYNGLDVLCSATSSEGFGMPIIESMACGTPVVATDCTSMTELLEPTPELLVKPVTDFWMTNNHKYWIPDKHDIADKLEKVANGDPDYYARKCREHSLKFDWETVIVPEWMQLLDRLQEEIVTKCKRIPEPSDWLKERWT